MSDSAEKSLPRSIPVSVAQAREKKRGKSIGREVDISNGALFLRIVALEREIQGLKLQLRDTEAKAHDAHLQTRPIGGGE